MSKCNSKKFTLNAKYNQLSASTESPAMTKLKFLWKSALKFSKTSPSLSRHLMLLSKQRISKTRDLALSNEANRHACIYCGNSWILGNCKHSLVSRRLKITKAIAKLKRLRAKNAKRLTEKQKRILEMNDNPSVTRVYRCGVCNKVTKVALKIPDRIQVKTNLKVGLHCDRTNKVIVPASRSTMNRDKRKKNEINLNHYTLKNRDRLKRKQVSESREHLMEQIRLAKTDTNDSKVKNKSGGNEKMVSVVKKLLQSDVRQDKYKPGHQLLSFLSNL